MAFDDGWTEAYIRFEEELSLMAFHVRNRETERLVRELARREKLGLTEAVHVAVANELRRQPGSLWDQIAPLRERLRKRIKDPRPVSKAFRDSLYEAKDSRVR